MLHNDVFSFVARNIGRALGLLFVVLLVSTNSLTARASSVGPYMVRDINLNGGVAPWSLTAWKGKLFFQLLGSPHKKGLWTSDGTAQGTYRLKKVNLYIYTSFVQAGKNLYFGANDGVHGYEPWVTDGTSEGTRMIMQLTPKKHSSGINFMGHVGNLALFSALMSRYEPYFSEFGRTDGTADGTRALTYLMPGNGVTVGKTFFFVANSHPLHEYTLSLWKSDGTRKGTIKVKDIGHNGIYRSVAMFGHDGLVWFLVTDNSGTFGLWQSDGTEQGTQMVKAIGSIVTSALPFAQVQDGVFFIFRYGTNGGYQLWYSDYTADGTIMLHDFGLIHSNIPVLCAAGNTLYLAAADETQTLNLWKSDGTPEGTVKVAGTNLVGAMASVGDTLYFSNTDETGDMELWQSDGTPEGTHRVTDINPQGSADPQWLTRVRNTLYFSADDGIHGRELWAYKP